jgi:PD-(D/E)XK nuclease superfamily
MKPLPISFSSLNGVKNCPRQHHEVKVLKRVQETVGEENIWGTRAHKAFELYLKSRGTVPMLAEFSAYQGYVDSILAMPGDMYLENKFAIDTSYKPCNFFRAKNLFARAVIDVMHIDGNRASLIDHKFGKYKPGSNQLALCSALVFHTFPQVQRIRAAYFWLKAGLREPYKYTREQLPAIWSMFKEDITIYGQIFADDIWPPRPSGLCVGWCPVSSCEYWKAKGSR